jgi:hypothetical protein
VILAFPGSGGKVENGIVFYEIASRIIPTYYNRGIKW